ncbi:hypothetical protein GH714_020483 [Hevea brasiliensis]|uniref:TF-B3 domain-containing protein n=1 Tax=Hevea brasiliensis TaxID=3981 RepID=A0A6A6N3A5_HEVBR|nr:hypothetical protein GH714_020483 [Hevea brasiliensis]
MANNEIFVKTLKETDIAKRLAIPAKALRLLPNFEDSRMSIEVTDHEGLFWRFECSIRRIGTQGLFLLAGTGWRLFVVIISTLATQSAYIESVMNSVGQSSRLSFKWPVKVPAL